MAVEVTTRTESLPVRAANFYQEVVAEMRKVTWPDREQLKDTTIKIIIFVLFIGAVLGIVDVILQLILVEGIPSLFKGGKKVNVERKIYPGYVLVEMVMDQETSHAINGIQGVIKFVGHERLPQPLRPDEVNRLLGIADEQEQEEPKEEIPFLIGQAVAITEGPFTDFNGTVEEVLADKGKVRVSVSLFGRPTSVELDYLQLKGY